MQNFYICRAHVEGSVYFGFELFGHYSEKCIQESTQRYSPNKDCLCQGEMDTFRTVILETDLKEGVIQRIVEWEVEIEQNGKFSVY